MTRTPTLDVTPRLTSPLILLPCIHTLISPAAPMMRLTRRADNGELGLTDDLPNYAARSSNAVLQ